MQKDSTPAPCPKAMALIEQVKQVYATIDSFHAVMLLKIKMEPKSKVLGILGLVEDLCVRGAIWFEYPRVRHDMSSSKTAGLEETEESRVAKIDPMQSTVIDDGRFRYSSDCGKWIKEEREVEADRAVAVMSAAFFPYTSWAEAGSFTALAEDTLAGHIMWVVEQRHAQISNSVKIWIDKETLFIRRIRWKYNEIPVSVTTVIDHQVFEPNINIPDEKFHVPPDVPFGKPSPSTFFGDMITYGVDAVKKYQEGKKVSHG